ncbi:MAG: TonB-dependent receptor [Acidobacteria bacterium]|nr:TonB-dependent receptor [Acidobacteriota bacterium]
MARTKRLCGGVAALTVILLSSTAWAQQASGIAGVVRDGSAAVLPGVTVEAASPALIEKVRTAVTDGEGRYNIVDLRPGTYAVSFTLPGFKAFHREGVVLTGGFTATVNGAMEVGALEETVTVTGAAPLVDTRNVRQQVVLSGDLLDALPTSMKGQNTVITLTPGLTGMADPSGNYTTQVGGTFHGKGGTKVQIDGMSIQNLQGNGNTGYQINSGTVEEMTLQTGGISAESSADGIMINVVPKEGGNTFSGNIIGLWANDGLESDNLSDELRSRGLTTVSKILKVYDASVTVGGRVKRDKLWFLGSAREWGSANQNAGVFWNKTQGTPFYTPDLSRPAGRYQWYESFALRLTWQASQKHKVNFFTDIQDGCICRSSTGIGLAPEAIQAYHFRPQALTQATWSSPLTNRLLFEAGAAGVISHSPRFLAPGVSLDHISIAEQSTALTYNAMPTYAFDGYTKRFSQRFSTSYVTGSHTFKAGFQVEEGARYTYTATTGGDVNYRFNNGIPNQITQRATPFETLENMKADLGAFVQDQWTIDRLTLNLGLRYDYFNAYVPAQDIAATRFVPARSYPRVNGVPLWHDASPRIGAAYDLRGNGRTALKFSIGRYVGKLGVDLAGLNNPVNTSVNSVTRVWTDTNANFVPDCNLNNRAANGECGALADQNFGGLNITTRYADDAIHGWGARDYNWDMVAEAQHQLSNEVSLTTGYYRNWYGNFRVTDNLSITPANHDPYCITAPADTRLPGGGGYQVCGLYNLGPARFGLVDNLVTQASNFGKQKQVSDFFGVSLNTRFASGMRIGGGVDTGRSVNDTCFVVDSPQQLLNCRVVTPFAGQTQLKLNGSYPLPAGFVVAAVYQNVSGPVVTASYAATNAQIAPSLGRNLTGATTATVPLMVPGTQFEDRTTRLDLRLSKSVPLGRGLRLTGNLDIYNAFNSSSILAITTAFGPRWRQPTQILDGRLFQFSGQFTF